MTCVLPCLWERSKCREMLTSFIVKDRYLLFLGFIKGIIPLSNKTHFIFSKKSPQTFVYAGIYLV